MTIPAAAAATVTDEALDVAAHLASVSQPRHGAVALFVGIVRDHDPSVEGEVTALEYVAHPDAAAALLRIVEAERIDGEVAVAATHRVGLLAVGEAALVVAVGTAHRAQAQAVCARIVEAIKRDVPVWKRELLANGTAHWVGVS